MFAAVDCKCSKCDTCSTQPILTLHQERVLHVILAGHFSLSTMRNFVHLKCLFAFPKFEVHRKYSNFFNCSILLKVESNTDRTVLFQYSEVNKYSQNLI